MDRLFDFWEFIEKDEGTPRTLITGRTLYLRLHCVRENVWGYRFIHENGMDVRDHIEGHVILDVLNKTLVRHVVTRDVFGHDRRDPTVIFQRIAELFFVNSKIYVGLPTLKHVSMNALSSMKT